MLDWLQITRLLVTALDLDVNGKLSAGTILGDNGGHVGCCAQ